MSEAAGTARRATPWSSAATWRRLFQDRPIIPLVGLLLLLVVALEVLRPGVVGVDWAAVVLRATVPLAILAACQTLTMLTGGIDLSVGAVASMAGFVVATFATDPLGWPAGAAVALVAAVLAGLLTGIGVGVFRVHPLIMTLAVSLVVFGLANVWQLIRVQTGVGTPPELRWLGAGQTFGLPNSLLVFVPIALAVLVGLRRTGYGRMLYAIGDNPIAARLSGGKAWQVLIVLYVISALLAAIAGFLYSGLTNVASVTLVDSAVLPSVAAAVIGGTSILGGRGGFGGTILGALILTVLTSLLSSLGIPEALRQVLFGAIIVVVAAAYTRVTAET
jgi:ribose transport system permease protein